ncbi:MAG TPA: creatininase family protein [Xanthobacteraceae bacterium]|nr:creatininase family protein [Xanthobacteraceae bacterium]
MERQNKRRIAELTSFEAARVVNANAVLCLPIGSLEQHGPHLPLNTDTVLAEAFTAAIVARWGDTYDLWQLPALPLGLSREHAWASGTISLSVATMAALLREVAGEIVRALPARNLVAINGHGGNRGLLEAIGRELAGDFGLNFCAMHLGAMMSPPSGAGSIEIHGGKDETSVMLALAPELVRQERMADSKPPADSKAVQALILDPATSWPWSSDDELIAHLGVIGEARAASVAHGRAIVERVVEAAGGVLARLTQQRR